MKYILSEFFRSDGKNGFNATNKARNDAIRIAVKNGYKHINLYESGKSKVKTIPQLLFNVMKMIATAKEGDTILVQYPYYPSVVNKFLFSNLLNVRKFKKYSLTVLIHDVVFLRKLDVDKCDLKAEINSEFQYMKHFDHIICHNPKMHELLSLLDDAEAKIDELGPFYYLYDKEKNITYSEKPHVIIAGNLSRDKTLYVYHLSETGVCFNLFGIGYENESDNQIKYFGKFSPEELINYLEGNYGLVWDGDKIETCSGSFGNYLRFNNPHKFSLYIAAGIPLIVWKRSALAEYVEKNGIGVCVNSLLELKETLSRISKSDYITMTENVKRVRKDIVSGKNLAGLL